MKTLKPLPLDKHRRMGLNPSYILCAAVLWIDPQVALADQPISSVPIRDDIINLQAGIICPPETVGTNIAPGTIAGATHIIDVDPPFAAHTQQIPAILGIGFGIKSQTLTQGGLDDITMTVTHPAIGADKTKQQNFTSRIDNQAPSLIFYQFDYPYELAEGTWTMTATHQDEVLFSVAFDVVPPETLPELANICGYDNLLS